MITHAAKLVWNANQWQTCSGVAENGVPVLPINGTEPYYYGLEEWLFNDVLVANKIGYLDCYRRRGRSYPLPANIALFTKNPNNELLHVGNIYGVREIHNEEIPEIREMLDLHNWRENVIGPNFNQLEFYHPGQSVGYGNYEDNNYNSNLVRAANPGGFVVNIRYNKIELFKNPVSLSQMDPEINISWKYLTVRYRIKNLNSATLLNHFDQY